MKAIIAALTSVVLFGAAIALQSQPFSVNWHTIDGGGGTSTGGVYAVSGTIGQADAGPTMTNGQYAVTGGFWALPQPVQTPGAPSLSIAANPPGFVTISWTPDTDTNWVLQETLSLSPTNWIDSTSGTNNPTMVAVTNAARFYRLKKP
jgi:hypothetical protein